MKRVNGPDHTHTLGWRLIGAFLFFGSCMLALTAAMVSQPDAHWAALLWSLRPGVRDQLAGGGWPVALSFVALSFMFSYAGVCWFLRRKTGWIVASLLVLLNLLGDVAQLFLGHVVEGLVGIVVGGILLAYMASPRIRLIFHPALQFPSGGRS